MSCPGDVVDSDDYAPLGVFGFLFLIVLWRFTVHRGWRFFMSAKLDLKQGFHLFLTLFAASRLATSALRCVPENTALLNVISESLGYCFNFTFLFFLEAHWSALLHARDSKRSRRVWRTFTAVNVVFYVFIAAATYVEFQYDTRHCSSKLWWCSLGADIAIFLLATRYVYRAIRINSKIKRRPPRDPATRHQIFRALRWFIFILAFAGAFMFVRVALDVYTLTKSNQRNTSWFWKLFVVWLPDAPPALGYMYLMWHPCRDHITEEVEQQSLFTRLLDSTDVHNMAAVSPMDGRSLASRLDLDVEDGEAPLPTSELMDVQSSVVSRRLAAFLDNDSWGSECRKFSVLWTQINAAVADDADSLRRLRAGPPQVALKLLPTRQPCADVLSLHVCCKGVPVGRQATRIGDGGKLGTRVVLVCRRLVSTTLPPRPRAASMEPPKPPRRPPMPLHLVSPSSQKRLRRVSKTHALVGDWVSVAQTEVELLIADAPRAASRRRSSGDLKTSPAGSVAFALALPMPWTDMFDPDMMLNPTTFVFELVVPDKLHGRSPVKPVDTVLASWSVPAEALVGMTASELKTRVHLDGDTINLAALRAAAVSRVGVHTVHLADGGAGTLTVRTDEVWHLRRGKSHFAHWFSVPVALSGTRIRESARKESEDSVGPREGDGPEREVSEDTLLASLPTAVLFQEEALHAMVAPLPSSAASAMDLAHHRHRCVSVLDQMSESFCAVVLPRLLMPRIFTRRRRQLIAARNMYASYSTAVSKLPKPPHLHASANMSVDRGLYEALASHLKSETVHELSLQWLKTRVATLTAYCNDVADCLVATKGSAPFKPSTARKDEAWRFTPINLHVQRFRVSQAKGLDTSVGHPLHAATYRTVTVGAPAAHTFKFKNHGMGSIFAHVRRLSQQLQRTSGTDDDINTTATKRALEDLVMRLRFRADVCVTHAISALVACFTASVRGALKVQRRVWTAAHRAGRRVEESRGHGDSYTYLLQLASCGFLIVWESLLSTVRHEYGMLDDMRVAVDGLQFMSFVLVDATEGGADAGIASDSDTDCSCADSDDDVEVPEPMPVQALTVHVRDIGVTDTECGLLVHVPVVGLRWGCQQGVIPPQFADGLHLPVTPVLVTQGINEMQAAGNLAGRSRGGIHLQDAIVTAGVSRLHSFVHKYVQFALTLTGAAAAAPPGAPLPVASPPRRPTHAVVTPPSSSPVMGRSPSSDGGSPQFQDLPPSEVALALSPSDMHTVCDWAVHRNAGVHPSTLGSPTPVRLPVPADTEVPSFTDAGVWGDVVTLGGGASESARLSLALWQLEQLRQAAAKAVSSKGIHVDVLKWASLLCRTVRGGRIMSCKSAKDRTAMSVTLEEARLLERNHGLEHDRLQWMADMLRAKGVRLDNTEKNTGRRAYCFNSVQRMFLPPAYKNPTGTGGGGLT